MIKYSLHESKGTLRVAVFNDSYIFDYPCDVSNDCTYYEAYVSPGTYIIETWGAEGGYNGGRGGYSRGIIHFSFTRKLNIFIGAKGDEKRNVYGQTLPSYNGGGSGFTCHVENDPRSAGSGGGATDIRANGASLNRRIIVSGGGGGGDHMHSGSSGGGINGLGGSSQATQDHAGNGNFTIGSYGSGAASGDFGYGGYATLESGCATYSGGGAGWYGGVSSRMGGGGAAGGSGYVLTATSHKPNGYKFSRNLFFSKPLLIDGDNLMPDCSGEFNQTNTVKGRNGNGCVRITSIYQSLNIQTCQINRRMNMNYLFFVILLISY